MHAQDVLDRRFPASMEKDLSSMERLASSSAHARTDESGEVATADPASSVSKPDAIILRGWSDDDDFIF